MDLLTQARRRKAILAGADLNAAVELWQAAQAGKNRPVYPAKRDAPGQMPQPRNPPPQKDKGPQPVPLRPSKSGGVDAAAVADAVERSVAHFNRQQGF